MFHNAFGVIANIKSSNYNLVRLCQRGRHDHCSRVFRQLTSNKGSTQIEQPIRVDINVGEQRWPTSFLCIACRQMKMYRVFIRHQRWIHSENCDDNKTGTKLTTLCEPRAPATKKACKSINDLATNKRVSFPQEKASFLKTYWTIIST